MGLEIDMLCTADMAKITLFLFVNFPTLMANSIDIGGLLNQAGGANGGLDVGSILNNANLNNLDLNNVDIGSIVDQVNSGDVDISGILDQVNQGQDQGDLNLETLLGMIPKDDNGKVNMAEGLKELEKIGVTLGKLLEMAGFGNNPQVVEIMKQFIDDPNSLDEGSKAMVCEAVEVLQEENPKAESILAGLGMDTTTLCESPSNGDLIHVSNSAGINIVSLFKFTMIVVVVAFLKL